MYNNNNTKIEEMNLKANYCQVLTQCNKWNNNNII